MSCYPNGPVSTSSRTFGQTACCADVKVLILTAKGQQQDRRTAEELGADDFVTKPYANADVVGAVRRLLGPQVV